MINKQNCLWFVNCLICGPIEWMTPAKSPEKERRVSMRGCRLVQSAIDTRAQLLSHCCESACEREGLVTGREWERGSTQSVRCSAVVDSVLCALVMAGSVSAVCALWLFVLVSGYPTNQGNPSQLSLISTIITRSVRKNSTVQINRNTRQMETNVQGVEQFWNHHFEWLEKQIDIYYSGIL